MNDTTLKADVLIIGAGPVGLTLAMDLASRGVSVIICETRRFAGDADHGHAGEPVL